MGIYDMMSKSLDLPDGELAKLAELQHQEELKRKLAAPPAPLLKGARELVLRKCKPESQEQVHAGFEKQPFGEVEFLVTQKLLDMVKWVAGEELDSENWLRLVTRLSDRGYEDMPVSILEFLDTEAFDVSIENCVSFLDPLTESWDIDLAIYRVEVRLNSRVFSGHTERFKFIEKEPEPAFVEDPGLKEFLRDTSLAGYVTEEEVECLKRLSFSGKRPTAAMASA